MKKNKIDRACGMHGGEDVHTVCWWGNLKESKHLEDLGVDGWVTVKFIFKISVGRVFTELIWFSTSGRFLCMWQSTFGFYKMWEFCDWLRNC